MASERAPRRVGYFRVRSCFAQIARSINSAPLLFLRGAIYAGKITSAGILFRAAPRAMRLVNALDLSFFFIVFALRIETGDWNLLF